MSIQVRYNEIMAASSVNYGKHNPFMKRREKSYTCVTKLEYQLEKVSSMSLGKH